SAQSAHSRSNQMRSEAIEQRSPKLSTIPSTPKSTMFVLLMVACLGTWARAQTTFSDGVFNDADWFTTPPDTHGNGGTYSDHQSGSGGDPGEYRDVSITVNDAPSSTDFSAICTFHWRAAAVYDPSSGSLESIDYSESSIMFIGSGEGQTTGPAILQN